MKILLALVLILTSASLTGAQTVESWLWHESAKLAASDGAPGDRFCQSVAIDGDWAILGAPGDADAGTNTGSAYIFHNFNGTGTGWYGQYKLTANDGETEDWFGESLDLEGDTAMIGNAFDGLLVGAAYVFTRPPLAGTGFCFGDPGSGTPCPCSNDNDGSVPGSGCDNGVFASGAQLTGRGIASVSDDSLVLMTENLEPLNSGLYFQANNQVGGGNGTLFGDGLRCAGGGLIRLEIVFADGDGRAQTSIAIGAKGGVSAGETKRYQHWYRTTQYPPCGLFVNDFNLTNGFEVTWTL